MKFKKGHGFKHGRTGLDKTYCTWLAMRKRCLNPKDKDFKRYGARGITVCERWNNENGFLNFLKDMGERPPRMTIDRIDNSGGYTPENCRWATSKEQANNTRSNHLLSYEGKTKTLSQWSDHLGINEDALRRRIYIYKMPIKKAMTEGSLYNNKFLYKNELLTIGKISALSKINHHTLRDRIESALGSGLIKPGDQLPPIIFRKPRSTNKTKCKK